MKSLVFFPGKACLNELGAVRVVASNLYPNNATKIEGCIVGMRHFANPKEASPTLTQVDLLPRFLRRSIPHRTILKTCKAICPEQTFSLKLQGWLGERLSVLADSLATEQIERLFFRNPEAEIALGFSSMSLAFGRAAKAASKRYAIHCQWCHPYVQNALVSEGYRSLGVTPPKVSKTRVARQLAEFELADIIWCPSKFVQQSLVDNGVPKEKTFVSYLGVDVKSFHVPEETRRPDDPFMILFVGNVCVQKGVHVLLEALSLADFPDGATMVFNGQPDSIAKRLIKEYEPQLSKKQITVRVDPGDPRRNHKKASVFVLPSLHDAYGIVVPEAMAAGLPIILSDHAGAHEIIEHDKNGFVFPSGNAVKLAEYLMLLEKIRETIKEYGRESVNMVWKYDKTRTALKIRRHFEQIDQTEIRHEK